MVWVQRSIDALREQLAVQHGAVGFLGQRSIVFREAEVAERAVAGFVDLVAVSARSGRDAHAHFAAHSRTLGG
jgi:hypothetical protein